MALAGLTVILGSQTELHGTGAFLKRIGATWCHQIDQALKMALSENKVPIGTSKSNGDYDSPNFLFFNKRISTFKRILHYTPSMFWYHNLWKPRKTITRQFHPFSTAEAGVIPMVLCQLFLQLLLGGFSLRSLWDPQAVPHVPHGFR